MSSLKPDKVIEKEVGELTLPAVRRGKSLLIIAVILLLTVTAFFIVTVTGSQLSTAREFSIKKQLVKSGSPWAVQLVKSEIAYEKWLMQHASDSELYIFKGVVGFVLSSALKREVSSKKSIFGNAISRSFEAALLRISFFILASWRLWLLAILTAIYLGIKSWKVHKGDDLLGQSGNGRLFYSGINARLENLTSEGIPDIHRVGLACPEKESESRTRNSAIGKLLDAYGALNDTNITLAAIILKHSDWAGFIVDGATELPVTEFNLAATSLEVLNKALAVHALYQKTGALPSQLPWEEQPVSTNQQELMLIAEQQQRVTSLKEYGRLLEYALDRVLTPAMRQIISEIPAEEIATLVLAHQAGKVLAYTPAGGSWFKESKFEQLSARAVLHSVAAYGQEYDYYTRTNLRQALIYGSRSTVFGPVRLPVDISARALAMRQWVEILMATPANLVPTADEVELFGLVRESFTLWQATFFDRIVAGDQKFSGVFAPRGVNLVFFSLAAIIESLESCFDKQALDRLMYLIELAGKRQAELIRNLEKSDDEALTIPIYERIPVPVSESEIQKLSKHHQIDPDSLRHWSALRYILSAHGFLARRVGDRTVPESGVTFVVFESNQSTTEAGKSELIGRAAQVVFRGNPFQEHFGPHWRDKFTAVNSAVIAETPEEYQRVLNGRTEPGQTENEAVNG
ncbi:MAG: hypothetical protein D6719_02650 [Candidatus Dadabacteria bacterium]|nr:MAG: hypothetical protein D6719_02650 [Candidatus Dadabacteria bacterium]